MRSVVLKKFEFLVFQSRYKNLHFRARKQRATQNIISKLKDKGNEAHRNTLTQNMNDHQEDVVSLHSTFGLSGKTCVVTGGTKGLGKAICDAFGACHARNVVTCSRSGLPEDHEWTHRDSNFVYVQKDVSKERERDSFLAEIKEKFGRVDVFVSNVGFNIRKKTAEFTREDYHALMGTNLEASFDIVRMAYKKGIIGRGTSVIFNSSVAGLTSIQTGAIYAMSKAALNQLTKSLACEWGREGIRVNAIAPWYINTDVAKQVLKNEEYKKSVVRRTPMGRVGEPREVASATVFLASQASSYVTGQILAIDGGFSVFGYAPPDGSTQGRDNALGFGAFKTKKKRRKDPNAPKQVKTAYLYFTEKERPKIIQQTPDMSPPDIMSELGARWKALSEKNRKPYEKSSEKDKLRYDEEMKSYQPPEGYDKDGYGFADDIDGRKKRAKKEPGQPKNVKSAYVYFCEVTRPSLPKGTHPVEIMKLMGEKWQKLSEDDRKPFEEKHEKDKARYETEMKAWREGKGIAKNDGAEGDLEDEEEEEEEDEEEEEEELEDDEVAAFGGDSIL